MLTIANGAKLGLNTTGSKFLGARTLAINSGGTLVHSGGQMHNQTANAVNNAGLLDIQGDLNWINNSGGPTTFNNLAGGVITKSAGTGTTIIYLSGSRATDIASLAAPGIEWKVVGAEIGKRLAGPGPCQDAREFEHANARERALLRTGHID